MKKLLLGIFAFLFATVVNAASTSPVGYWKTIDDVSGKPKSIVKITKNSHQELAGQVVKIFPKPGESQNKLCEACTGDKHNKPIVGMVILTGLKFQGDEWSGGEILDPKTGKVYKCTLKVASDGSTLSMHGYIGITLFGRTQTWIRVKGA